MSKANPVPCKSTDKPGKVMRNVFCAHYEQCLDRAIKEDWSGFSCEKCLVAKHISIDEEWANIDSTKCMYIWECSNNGSVPEYAARR